jgi:predicted aspartyl protease
MWRSQKLAWRAVMTGYLVPSPLLRHYQIKNHKNTAKRYELTKYLAQSLLTRHPKTKFKPLERGYEFSKFHKSNTCKSKIVKLCLMMTTLKRLLPGTLCSHPSTQNKKQKSYTSLVPIVFADLKLINSTKPSTLIKVLLDSGASATLIKANWLSNLHQTSDDEITRWTTSTGTFKTKQKAIARMLFTELHESKTITYNAHVAPILGVYDMIIGREILKELGILLNFKDETIEWDGVIIPMKPEEATPENSFAIKDSATLDDATERMKKILDAKYEAADINNIVTSCTHLSQQEQCLLKVLTKYKSLFDGSLGTWKDEEYNIELKQMPPHIMRGHFPSQRYMKPH